MSGASPHHAIIGEIHDLPGVGALARWLRRRRGVLRGDARAPIADRVVELQPPVMKPSCGHDGTPTDGTRMSRSSARNCLLRSM